MANVGFLWYESYCLEYSVARILSFSCSVARILLFPPPPLPLGRLPTRTPLGLFLLLPTSKPASQPASSLANRLPQALANKLQYQKDVIAKMVFVVAHPGIRRSHSTYLSAAPQQCRRVAVGTLGFVAD